MLGFFVFGGSFSSCIFIIIIFGSSVEISYKGGFSVGFMLLGSILFRGAWDRDGGEVNFVGFAVPGC